MKNRVAVWTAGAIGAFGLSLQLLAAPPSHQHTRAAAAVALLPAVEGGDSQYTYVGSKKCKKCHINQHKSWSKTRMAKALNILRPGNSKEIKEQSNLDVNKDYTTDPACLKCHTTGYGKSGGYEIPVPDDKKSMRRARKLAGVGCESCHGPGSGYVEVFDEILKSKRQYKVEELHAVGLQKVSEATCEVCHNEESPTIKPGDTFDYEKRKQDGTHEHLPLKQRAE